MLDDLSDSYARLREEQAKFNEEKLRFNEEKIKQEQNKIGLYIFYIYKAIATYIGNFTRSPNQHRQQKVN